MKPCSLIKLFSATLIIALNVLAAPFQSSMAQVLLNPGDQLIDEVVLIINDQAITAKEFRVLRLLQDQNQGLGQDVDASLPVLGEAITEAIIDERLLAAHALRIAPDAKISPIKLNESVRSIAQGNQLSAEQLLLRLQSQGIDLRIFKESLEQRLLVQEVIAARVSRNIKVSSSEVREYINNRPELRRQNLKKYRASHLVVSIPESATEQEIAALKEIALISRERLLAGESFAEIIFGVDQVTASSADGDLGLKSQDELPALFVSALEKLEIGQMSPVIESSNGFHLLALKETESLSAAPKEYKLRHILKIVASEAELPAIANTMKTLRQQILAGLDFAEVARTQSQDTGSSQKGGDLGWVKLQQVDPQFAKALQSLEVGQISEAIQTPFGLHLIQLLETRDVSGVASLSVRVQNKLFAEKVNEALEDLLNDIKQIALIEVIEPV